MPITLIRNTKDNAMHGTDNGKYTGCRMKLAGGSWYTREGELKDITDLTCERCKEVFATKMIRESNKEELRIAKEEKKRYQRAKKQGIVREATYEEYLMNREAEASAKRDSRNDEATSSSLQKLRDAIPAENVQPGQPVFTSYGGSQSGQAPVVTAPQAPFDTYGQKPAVTAPQNMFDPYAQQAPAQTVVPPQNIFDPYAQNAPAQGITAPQNMFDPYSQTPAASVPPSMFDPYAQNGQAPAPQNMFDPYSNAAPSAPAQQSVVSAPQAPFDPYAYAQPQNTFDPFAQNSSAPSNSLEFGAISAPSEPETKTEEPTPVFQEYTGAASVSVNTPVQNTSAQTSSPENDDFLSQFLVKPQPMPETTAPAAPASEPVTAENIVSATDDILSQFSIGSQLAGQPEHKAEPAPAQAPVSAAARADASSFFSDSIPVIGAEYAGASSVNSAVTEFGSLNIAEPAKDEFVVPDVPVYQPSGNNYVSQNVNNFSKSQTSVFMDELAAPGTPSAQTSAPMSNFAQTESIMNGFDSAPVPSTDTMSGFGGNAPVQPAANSFNSVPQNPYAQPQNTYAQPQNTYAQPQNTYAQPQNTYAQPQNPYAQPQNPYAQPQQSTGFQMPQGYGAPAQASRPAAPAPKPAQKPSVFAPHTGTADSIEEALRQLGADVAAPQNANQMPEKEELVPDFVAYVPSSSKVLHQSAPSQSASSNVPKRPISAREAKQLAKIDAKFKKDLISRGFNPNEIKNGRRGK
ncbi:hypothetical protein [Ruminococcus sp. HUN007]|uniref:hypothetical protein n=1 Tax=Ruminococcus sp. HUN007 TaxID=1514668 RepID=UPI0005D177F4|nr:hypothetical protein [Ruminococcus sp. HUN007]